jgi:hypothetical protein
MSSRHRLCAAHVEEYAQNEVRSTSIASTTLLRARKAAVAPEESVEIFMLGEKRWKFAERKTVYIPD